MTTACDHKDEPFFLTYAPSDSAIAYFQNDAGTFAIEQLFHEKSPDTLSIIIPDRKLDYYLNALGLLYDKKDEFIALDSVINKVHIHKQQRYSTGLGFLVDTTYQWFKNIRDGLPQSGNTTIDSLAQLYSMAFHTDSFSDLMSANLSSPLNTYALARLFTTIPGIRSSGPDGYYSWYTNLTFKEGNGEVRIRFYLGYGDCPSGCGGYDYWDFVVTNDGKINYKGFTHD
ncbi:hypothetical protein F9K33_16250 [bacterium]|nr:MAG: hypothetical protein F9K33_16250 [bacterium]